MSVREATIKDIHWMNELLTSSVLMFVFFYQGKGQEKFQKVCDTDAQSVYVYLLLFFVVVFFYFFFVIRLMHPCVDANGVAAVTFAMGTLKLILV